MIVTGNRITFSNLEAGWGGTQLHVVGAALRDCGRTSDIDSHSFIFDGTTFQELRLEHVNSVHGKYAMPAA